MGVYIDEVEARSKLGEMAVSKEMDDFVKDKDSVLDKIIKDGVGVSIRIIPTRKVTWNHIYDGLEKQMSTLLWKRYDLSLEEIDNCMAEVKNSFGRNQELPTTDKLDFVRRKDTLVIMHNEVVIKEITDARLTETLFSLYLGPTSRVPEIRQEFYERLHTLLRNKSPHNITWFVLH
eukprot:gene15423-18291_t